METTKKVTLDGLHLEKIKKIKGLPYLSHIRDVTTLLKSLSKNIATYLMDLLGNYIMRGNALSTSQQKSVDVYDLIDVEVTKRFQVINGTILHNCLGLSYGMGPTALADKLTVDTGVKHEYEDAKELSDLFWEAFPEYADWIEDLKHSYNDEDMIVMPDGWTMWGDNDNPRSVGNMPIQGMGAVILRKAIQLAQDAGLTVIIPLHDALYIELDTYDWNKIDLLCKCMTDAFAFYFTGKMKGYAQDLIRLDVDVWGPDLKEEILESPMGVSYKCQKIYIDPRSKDEYNKFSKYFKAK